ncbi:MAG: phosphatidylserine decarboxylase [Planctomycetaceae bacterium]|nr:phosphatidylserine decarboxylase [Planctomycetaceae bacterium]
MRLTPLGAREVGLSAAVFCVGAIIFISLFRRYDSYLYLVPVVLLAVVFAWVLWFFRDPGRVVPTEPGVIVSPADGTVTHIDEADEPDYIGGQAQRFSIFLSIFDVHLNRSPAAGRVEFLRFRPGAFFDARTEESLAKNQNQDVGFVPTEMGMPSKMVVRQSTGAIARRIICPVEKGMELRRGEKYGMIKFGSRTTLFMAKDASVEWLVKVGDKVKAGETVIARVLPAGNGTTAAQPQKDTQ